MTMILRAGRQHRTEALKVLEARYVNVAFTLTVSIRISCSYGGCGRCRGVDFDRKNVLPEAPADIITGEIGLTRFG